MAYVVAVVVFVLAVLVRMVFDPWVTNPSLLSFVAVVLAALYGGRRPAALMLVLGAVSELFFRRYAEADGVITTAIVLSVYTATSLGAIFMIDRVVRARERAEGQSREASERGRRLEREIEEGRRMERQAAERHRALKRRYAQVRALIEASPIPICWTWDPRCREIEGNDAYRRLLGAPAGTNVSGSPNAGEPPFRIYRGDREVPPEDLPLQRCTATGRVIQGEEFDIVRADNVRLVVMASAAPMFDGDRVCGAVGQIVDITERKQAEAERAEAERRKDEFLAMLAHELRNPLAPIRNALAIMQQGAGGERVPWALRVIERQLQQLTRITDDLLELARIAKGQIVLHEENVDFRAVIERAIETSRPLIQARRHRLRVHVSRHELRVNADAARMAQAISNLLNNAARYTPEGGAVFVSGRERDGVVEVCVRDTGRGIDPALLPRVFDAFFRGDDATARSTGGLGVGLTIAKRIAELHGGTLTASSRGPGQGSEFVIGLPAAAADSAGREAAAQAVVPHPCRRILVVDDNQDVADSVATLLNLRGHEVESCYDASSTLDKALAFRPDVAILDIGLPGMDGCELARLFRAHALLNGCALIAMSGYGQPADLQRSAAAGFDCHLLKPTDPQMLYDTVERAYSTAVFPNAVNPQAAPPAESQGESPAAG